MKWWCFLHHFCLFAFQTVVFASSTVPFLNEVFFFFSLRKNQLAFCALARRKSWIMLCSICARAYCVWIYTACVYIFKRAKAKRIIAWRRSFLFFLKRHRDKATAMMMRLFQWNLKEDPNEPNSKEESFVRNRSSSQWHRERKVRTHSFVTSTQHACTRRITLFKRNDIADYGAFDSRAWIRSERRLSSLFSFCARTFFACVFDPRRKSGNARVLGTCERIRWDLGR